MEKNIIILQHLLERTKKRESEWTPTNLLDQFSINIGTGKIVIEYDRPKGQPSFTVFEADYDYRATFYNKKDLVIDSVIAKKGSKGSPTYQILEDLWNEIEDANLGKKETLDSMMKALGLHK